MVGILERIRAISNLHKVPIAIISASNDPTDISRAREMGAVDFIKKPVEKDSLLKMIQRNIKTTSIQEKKAVNM
jgi:CheY-like chemotaxis protein